MTIWLLLVVATLSCLMTGVLRRYALARSIIDIPNARSSHSVPTPRGGGVVIRSAARVHVINDQSSDPLAEFRQVNVEGAAPGTSYKADDVPAPVDPYGISKMEAEQWLQALAVGTGIEVVIIRPVLVYGPGVKANFLSMMKWLNKGAPPFRLNS